MIEWKPYIPHHKPTLDRYYLVTNGSWVASAVLSEAKNAHPALGWVGELGYLEGVTHYAEINLPGPHDFEPGDVVEFYRGGKAYFRTVEEVSGQFLHLEQGGAVRWNNVGHSSKSAMMAASEACEDRECGRFRNSNGGCDKCGAPSF